MQLRSPPRRTPIGLTPMIDVVFLLLVFFMLAARFANEGAIAVPLATEGEPGLNSPRLVDVSPASLRLNGIETPLGDLVSAVTDLEWNIDDVVVLRPRDAADVQRLVDVLQTLTDAGYSNVVLLE